MPNFESLMGVRNLFRVPRKEREGVTGSVKVEGKNQCIAASSSEVFVRTLKDFGIKEFSVSANVFEIPVDGNGSIITQISTSFEANIPGTKRGEIVYNFYQYKTPGTLDPTTYKILTPTATKTAVCDLEEFLKRHGGKLAGIKILEPTRGMSESFIKGVNKEKPFRPSSLMK